MDKHLRPLTVAVIGDDNSRGHIRASMKSFYQLRSLGVDDMIKSISGFQRPAAYFGTGSRTHIEHLETDWQGIQADIEICYHMMWLDVKDKGWNHADSLLP